jgi:regulator of protease activity HflC (stomatin/prohibitin superfamily)
VSFVGFILILLVIAFISGLRVVNQYEKGVVLRFGKYITTKGPGLKFIMPYGIDRMIKVDMRIATVDVPRQEVITKDNVTIYVDAVVYFRVKNTEKAILDVQNFRLATAQYAQAALRDVVGQEDLDTLLSERQRISDTIKVIVDKATEPWGIDVIEVKMQKMELPEDMKRVIAKQAEAEREKRSVITKARGEFEAAQNLADAAKKLASTPGALHLRTLTTLNDLSSDQSNTVIFAVPLEILRAFEAVGDKQAANGLAKVIQNMTSKE